MANARVAGAPSRSPIRGGRADQNRQQWREQRAERQAERQAQPAAQQRQYTPRAAPQQQQQSVITREVRQATTADQRQGNRGSGSAWNRRDNANNDWGQARAAQVRAQAEARQQVQAQAQAQYRTQSDRSAQRWDGNRTQSDRTQRWDGNRTYSDGRTVQSQQRNRSYSDGNRNQTYTSQGYRDQYRDGRRTDGRRYDGYNGGNHQRWSNDWRRDNRYNWYSYRNANRSLFNVGRYYSPYSNYRYSRLSIGFSLDSLFYSNRYWINDPWQYRLPAGVRPLPLGPLLRRCAAGERLHRPGRGRDLRLLLVSFPSRDRVAR